MAAGSATARPVQAAFRVFPVQVERAVRLTPQMARITFTGPTLSGFRTGNRDQRGKILFPAPGLTEPLLPEGAAESGWYAAWRTMPPETRPILRTYTFRAQRTDPDEVDIDFALHGDGGPAGRWAAAARPGDRVLLVGPAREDAGGVNFQPPPGTESVVLAGDETALPAMTSIAEGLPPGLPVQIFAEVAGPAEEQPLPATAQVTWVHRGHSPSPLLDAVRGAALPDAAPYFWLAGEASAIKELRRHLVRERGVDRGSVCFQGYWRRGLTEDQDDSTAPPSPSDPVDD
ncbi:siderophore-interacting protein [Streptomyces sp. SID10853]|uniref:siderophore-interacting protein n=1 Tax=Streptomyces sp. SID10853 TaxID=2706028 RepID=UPI0013BFBD9D|nr:siderophore-interacting protein [Streptomyces sp. SID10853]NDZ81490.1 siderophore-interacting protein [Streptomyces sp. SID10853]